MNARIARLLAHANYPHLLPVYGKDYRVHLGQGRDYTTPYTQEGWPCVVYWFGEDIPEDFLHELGHVVNYTHLATPGRYEQFRDLIGGPARPWWWDRNPMLPSSLPDPYCEGFADLYAMAQLHMFRVARLDTPTTIHRRPPLVAFRRRLRPYMNR